MANPFESAADNSYNPFAVNDSMDNVEPPAPSSAYADPEILYTYEPPQQNKPTEYNNTQSYTSPAPSGVKDSITGLKISEDELRRREEALSRREQQLSSKEELLQEARANGTAVNPYPKNFPIFFKWYKYYKETGLEKRALGEASVVATNYAKDHQDDIVQAAKDNPELISSAASMAANNYN